MDIKPKVLQACLNRHGSLDRVTVKELVPYILDQLKVEALTAKKVESLKEARQKHLNMGAHLGVQIQHIQCQCPHLAVKYGVCETCGKDL